MHQLMRGLTITHLRLAPSLQYRQTKTLQFADCR